MEKRQIIGLNDRGSSAAELNAKVRVKLVTLHLRPGRYEIQSN